MEIKIVTDDRGEIVAVHKGDVAGPTDAVPSAVGFVARHGQQVHNVYVSDDVARQPLEEIHRTMRVYVKEGQAVLRSKLESAE